MSHHVTRTRQARRWLVPLLLTLTAMGGCSEEDPDTSTPPHGDAGEGGRDGGDAGGEGPVVGKLGLGGSSDVVAGAGEGGEVAVGGPHEPAPYLVEATPPDGATGVYPFPLPNGVSIRLTFSESMSTELNEANLRADGVEKAVPIEWAESGKEALVVIAPNPLTGAPPLLDLTSYTLDLSPLESRSGIRLDPQQSLANGGLRFTTSTFDPLLNHACGHVEFGPFDSAAASELPSAQTVPTDTGHINYTITLPKTEAGYEGYTRVTTLMDRHYHFLFDRDVPLALSTEGALEEPLKVEPASAACAGITHRAAFDAALAEDRFLHLGPIPTSNLHMIVEVVTDG